MANDTVGVDVPDRAQVELALIGQVLGDVSEPDLVRRLGAELVGHLAVLINDAE